MTEILIFYKQMMDWNKLIHAFLEKNKQINLSAIRDEE